MFSELLLSQWTKDKKVDKKEESGQNSQPSQSQGIHTWLQICSWVGAGLQVPTPENVPGTCIQRTAQRA